MSEINITLPDKSVKVLPKGVTPQEVANSIGSGLARAVVVAKIDGELKDADVAVIIGAMLAVDRPLDMMRTMVNIFSDSIGASVIAKSEGETLYPH